MFIQVLRLLSPAIIPSWRFFDVIAPSPRIEIAVMHTQEDEPQNWQEYRPRPATLTITSMLKRMIWNPHWNESLFLMSCAERLVNGEEAFASNEIFGRIKNDMNGNGFVQFRLVFHAREGKDIKTHIAYISSKEPFGQEGG